MKNLYGKQKEELSHKIWDKAIRQRTKKYLFLHKNCNFNTIEQEIFINKTIENKVVMLFQKYHSISQSLFQEKITNFDKYI